MNESANAKRLDNRWWLVPTIIASLPVIVVFVIVFLILWIVAVLALLMAVWVIWFPRGRRILVVYSNSPIWKLWFEQRALPTLGSRAVVLNWSERKRWKRSLAVYVFRVFGGDQNFNPLIMVFDPFPRTFRFYPAFREYKHGKPESVEKLWSECLR